MAPAHVRIPLPENGIFWLESEESDGPCDTVRTSKWERRPAGASELFVHANGPSGSGRYWTVTVGIGEKGARKPNRGTCFSATTVGWRTLQRFQDAPLRWLDDLNHDGNAEVIVWDSFALHDDASASEFGLTAWVYRLGAGNTLELDLKLSRVIAKQIAAAYRLPLDPPDPYLEPLRKEAANDLEGFADGQCSAADSDESSLHPPQIQDLNSESALTHGGRVP